MKNEWISIKDRLPGNDEYVLIGWIDELYNKYPEDGDCSLAFGNIKKVGDKIYSTIKFGGVENHYILLQIDTPPTHWMPVPEPPRRNK